MPPLDHSLLIKLGNSFAVIYVDDTDILLTDATGNGTLEQVFLRAQKAAKVWQQAVYDSGGAVRPNKCYWTAVDFVFTSGKWGYMKENEFDGEIAIKNTNNEYEVMKRFDINKANEGLGLYVTPNGRMDLQLKNSLEKIKTWSDRLHKSSLTQKEAYIGVNTTIFKTAEYILPGTSFTETQCALIERTLY